MSYFAASPRQNLSLRLVSPHHLTQGYANNRTSLKICRINTFFGKNQVKGRYLCRSQNPLWGNVCHDDSVFFPPPSNTVGESSPLYTSIPCWDYNRHEEYQVSGICSNLKLWHWKERMALFRVTMPLIYSLSQMRSFYLPSNLVLWLIHQKIIFPNSGRWEGGCVSVHLTLVWHLCREETNW